MAHERDTTPGASLPWGLFSRSTSSFSSCPVHCPSGPSPRLYLRVQQTSNKKEANVFLSSPSWIYPWLKDTSDYDPITAPTACAVFAVRDTEISPCLKVPPQTAHHWTIHHSWMASNSFPKIVFGIKQIKQIDVSRKSLLKYMLYLKKGVRLHGHLEVKTYCGSFWVLLSPWHPVKSCHRAGLVQSTVPIKEWCWNLLVSHPQ